MRHGDDEEQTKKTYNCLPHANVSASMHTRRLTGRSFSAVVWRGRGQRNAGKRFTSNKTENHICNSHQNNYLTRPISTFKIIRYFETKLLFVTDIELNLFNLNETLTSITN